MQISYPHILLICCFLITTQVAAIIKVNTKNQFFVDEYDRVRVFHGVNAVFKIPPWHPETEGFDSVTSLSEIDAANLRDWGFNAIRLGVMFPGVSPTGPNQFNETYINIMKTIVEMLGDHDIYSIVDAHQDLFSRQFCGEGFPDWATETSKLSLPFAKPIAEVIENDPTTGYPDITKCLERSFAEYYFADKVGSAFQHLYDNSHGIQDGFAAYWGKLSSVFNETEYVLGYELINEPWAGDVYSQPDLLLPGEADKKNLAPMYKNLNAAIRQHDQEHIVFFEKAVVDVIGRSGLETGPGGVEYNDRQVFSYHVYCAPTDREGTPSNIVECDFVDAYFYELAMLDVAKLGCGGMLTEFGAVPNTTISLESIQFLADEADKRLQSWTYWQFKYYDDITTAGQGESLYNIDGELEVDKLKALSRTYAQAIAGVPTLMHFDTASATFSLVFTINTAITEPTIIYLNEQLYYPYGFTLKATPSASIQWIRPEPNFVHIQFTKSAVNATSVTISISPIQ